MGSAVHPWVAALECYLLCVCDIGSPNEQMIVSTGGFGKTG